MTKNKSLIYLSLTVFILLINSAAYSQNWGTISLTLQPANHGVGIGVDGSYGNQDIGFFGNVTVDARGKHNSPNLETGVGADIAVLLRQTSHINSFVSATGGIKKHVAGVFWLQAGAGVTFYDEFTEHESRYWVFRGREAKFNATGGALIALNRLALTARANAEPLSFLMGIGITL